MCALVCYSPLKHTRSGCTCVSHTKDQHAGVLKVPEQQLFIRRDLHSFSCCRCVLSDCMAEQPAQCINLHLPHSNAVYMPDGKDTDLREYICRMYYSTCCVIILSHISNGVQTQTNPSHGNRESCLSMDSKGFKQTSALVLLCCQVHFNNVTKESPVVIKYCLPLKLAIKLKMCFWRWIVSDVSTMMAAV